MFRELPNLRARFAAFAALILIASAACAAGNAPADKIIAEALASPFTRLPVWVDEPENIVGVIHVKDLLRAIQAAGGDASERRAHGFRRRCRKHRTGVGRSTSWPISSPTAGASGY